MKALLLFCENNEPSANTFLHEHSHLANVHHRAKRGEDMEGVERRSKYEDKETQRAEKYMRVSELSDDMSKWIT